eukprot:344463-Prymnesium_polylepis.1
MPPKSVRPDASSSKSRLAPERLLRNGRTRASRTRRSAAWSTRLCSRRSARSCRSTRAGS